MMQNYDLTITISSFNRENKVLQTVNTLLESDLTKFERIELIVVDDGSPVPVAPLMEKVEHVPANVELRMITQSNSGIGATRNRGYREARSRTVLFLDDDIIVEKNTIHELYSAQKEKKGVVFGNYPFITHTSKSLERFAYGLYNYDLNTNEKKYTAVQAITSGLLCVNKDDLNNMAEFYRDDMTIPAAEEHELIFRFHQQGIPIYHAAHVSAIHNHDLNLDWMCQQQYKYGMATAEAFSKFPDLASLKKFSDLRDSLENTGGIKGFVKKIISGKKASHAVLKMAKKKESSKPDGNHNFIFGLATTAFFLSGYREGKKKFKS